MPADSRPRALLTASLILLTGCTTRPKATPTQPALATDSTLPSPGFAPISFARPAPYGWEQSALVAPPAPDVPVPPFPAPAPAPAPVPPPPTSAPDAEVVVLDVLEVTTTRVDATETQLSQNATEDRQETALARASRQGGVSRALNGWRLPFFTIGFTADRLAEGADRRAEILAQERIVLLALRDAKTKEERAALKADLRALRELRRAMIATDPRPSSPGP